jgi:hypothetical protein
MAKESSTTDEVRRSEFMRLLTDAFYTWPSALTIALTLIAFFVNPIQGVPNWAWLIVGGVLEAIYLITTVTDPTARRQANLRILADRFDPADIKNLHAREQMRKALEYKRTIDSYVTKQEGPLRTTLDESSRQINQWVELMYNLAQNIDRFEGNDTIRRDLASAPAELSALKRRLTIEKDPAVRRQLEEAVEAKQQLLTDLQRVASDVKRTEIKMDTTVTQLGKVYASMQLMSSSEMDSGRAQRMVKDIREEILSLNDIVDSMRDYYGTSAGASGGSDRYDSAVSSLSESADTDADRGDTTSGQQSSTQRNSQP